jgi:V8-like Glu-specific endopeptidase
MANNIIKAVKELSDNLSELKKEVTALPELKSSRAIINPFENKLSPKEKEKRKYLILGLKALNKIENGTEEHISEDEERGLEAIILQVIRPAILIKKGRFSPPPAQWKILNEYRQQIEQSFKCVGRIEVSGHPTHEWIGTGFIVGKGVIMTNRHVAVEFGQQNDKKWNFISNRSASINFIKEFEVDQSLEFKVEGIIGIHDKLDLALLSINEQSQTGKNLSTPLEIISKDPKIKNKQNVYVVGYPASDGTRNEPEVMRKIFADIYDVKRLQPGVITGFNQSRNELLHDCSTLGGNSGSPVFDLRTSQVIGLHFGGRYLQNNYAVALWTLINDPLLRDNVNYV